MMDFQALCWFTRGYVSNIFPQFFGRNAETTAATAKCRSHPRSSVPERTASGSPNRIWMTSWVRNKASAGEVTVFDWGFQWLKKTRTVFKYEQQSINKIKQSQNKIKKTSIKQTSTKFKVYLFLLMRLPFHLSLTGRQPNNNPHRSQHQTQALKAVDGHLIW